MPLRVWLVLTAGLSVLGTSAILIRYATDAPGLSVAVWRTVFSAMLIAPFALRRARAEMVELKRKDVLLVSAAGALLGLHFVFWIEALYQTSVASASVLVTTSPIFIATMGFFVLGERLRAKTSIAILMAVGGAILIGRADVHVGAFPNASLGNGLALVAALLFAVYILIGRAVRQRTSFLAYLFPLYSVAAFTCLAVALLQGVPLAQPPLILGLCLLMALGPQLIGHGAFNYAIRYVPAARLGLLTLTEPIGASLLALLLFGEIPGVLALAGMLIVLFSIALVFIRSR